MEKLVEILLQNPETASDILKPLLNKYKPVAYSIFNEFFGIYKDLVGNDEFYVMRAIDKRKTYESLIKVGFSEDQAMALMLNDNLHRIDYSKRMSTSAGSVSAK